MAFFERFALGRAAEPAQSAVDGSLAEGVRDATAVVVAEVVDVVGLDRPGNAAQGDRFRNLGIVLRVHDVVTGALPDSEITVVFFADDRAGLVEGMRAARPAGLAVWFVRPRSDKTDTSGMFVTSSFQGLFVQGRDHVVSPRDPGERDNMAAEGRRYARLSQLVAHIRTLG